MYHSLWQQILFIWGAQKDPKFQYYFHTGTTCSGSPLLEYRVGSLSTSSTTTLHPWCLVPCVTFLSGIQKKLSSLDFNNANKTALVTSYSQPKHLMSGRSKWRSTSLQSFPNSRSQMSNVDKQRLPRLRDHFSCINFNCGGCTAPAAQKVVRPALSKAVWFHIISNLLVWGSWRLSDHCQWQHHDLLTQSHV